MKKKPKKKINSLDELKDFLAQQSFNIKEDALDLSQENKQRKEELFCQQINK